MLQSWVALFLEKRNRMKINSVTLLEGEAKPEARGKELSVS